MKTVQELLPLLKAQPRIRGLNVTIPHKQAVIPLLDELDAVARDIGAVNTIQVHRDEWDDRLRLVGYNTDARGFERSLREQLLDAPVEGDKALVLGTGGSSRAVCFVLKRLGMEVIQVSRHKAGGVLSYRELDGLLMKQCRLVVNTTPLGMYPKVDDSPDLPYEALGPGHLLFDLVYNPERTLFLQKGEAQGARAANGYDMLVYQAEASWDIWNEAR
jgi:shikimate dehydrogenase